jgi:hypothetical protein
MKKRDANQIIQNLQILVEENDESLKQKDVVIEAQA